MNDRFRFLINVDQSIHLTSFDLFFYKLQHQRRLLVRDVQLAEDETERTLHDAVMAIRLYLDRFPYHINDFEIIVTMRRLYSAGETPWRQSLLYRLLRLRYELRLARLYIASKENKEKALTLIMLYDTDLRADLPKLGDYMTGKRLAADLELLLREIGIDDPRSIDHAALQGAVDGARQTLAQGSKASPVGEAELCFLEDFLETHPEVALPNEAQFLERDAYSETQAPTQPASAQYILLEAYLADQLTNAQVLERMIDRNDERSKILAQLRVAEYINADVAHEYADAERHTALPLAQRCRASWDRIWEDAGLEARYAEMLSAYDGDLREALRQLEGLDFSVADQSHRVPEPSIPGKSDLVAGKGALASARSDTNNPAEQLKQFRERHLSPDSALREWETVCSALKQKLSTLELLLKNYAQDLSAQYMQQLELRKQMVQRWNESHFYADDNTPELRHTVEFAHEHCIEQLKSPHMTPSLKFQDQLNMETALEQENLNIRFYLQCIQAVNVGNFLMLLLVICGMAFVHHTLMQYYVLQEATTMMAWLVYFAALAVLMLFTWYTPYAFFRRKVNRSVDHLIEQMGLYLDGFDRKAEYFETYMNLLNQQDYLNRYLRMLREAEANASQRNHVRSWHMRKIREHLTKLRYFNGLVELGHSSGSGERALRQRMDFNDMDMVKDEISTPIYWPQG